MKTLDLKKMEIKAVKNLRYVPALVLLLLAAVTTQASAQLFDLPIRVIFFDDAADAHLDASIGTGLNNASGKTEAVSFGYEKETSSLGIRLEGGYVLSGVNEPTLAASLAAPLKKSGNSTISLQGGLGWFGFDAGITSINNFSIPVMIGFQTRVDSGEADITLFGAPRLQLNVASGGGNTNTSTNLGVSAGVLFALQNNIGLHAELDYLNTSGSSPLLFAVGARYRLGR